MEWLIILAVVLLLFGHRIPSMARSLGSGITEFKRGLKDGSGSKDDDKASGSDKQIGQGSQPPSHDSGSGSATGSSNTGNSGGTAR